MRPPSRYIVGVVLLLVLSLGAAAQQLSLRGPTSGLVFDPVTQSLRPVMGALGAAHLGPAVVEGVRTAAVAPHGKTSLVVLDDSVQMLQRLDSDRPLQVPLEGIVPEPDGVIWAPDSAYAVICSSTRRQFQFVRDPDGAPSLSPAVDFPGLTGSISFLIAEPSSEGILLGIVETPASGVYRITASDPPMLIAAMEGPSAAAFSPDGGQLYLADRIQRKVFRGDFRQGSYQAELFLGELDGLNEPLAVAASPDGQSLYISDGSRNVLQIFSVPERSLTGEISLDKQPEFLRPLSRHAFLLNHRHSKEEPLMVLETSAGTSLFFVPCGE